MPAEREVVLAQLSDLHVDGGERSRARVARAVGHLVRPGGGVDAVLVTGDVTDVGTPGQYAAVRELLEPLRACTQVVVCPGNHDAREAFREHLLGEPPGAGPVERAVEVAGVTLAVCDSTVPGEPYGLLSAASLDWLDAVLAASAGPAVVVLHHPPVPLGIPWLDGMRLREAGRLAAVLDRHPRVAAVLCGHAHTAAAGVFAGRPLLVAPAVDSTVRLPWEGAGPSLDAGAPVGLAFHRYAAGAFVTHFRSLPPGGH